MKGEGKKGDDERVGREREKERKKGRKREGREEGRKKEFEFEWEFYAQLASKAIFRARTYNCITYSVR